MNIFYLLAIGALFLHLFSNYIPIGGERGSTIKVVICFIVAMIFIIMALLIMFSVIPTPGWAR